MSNVAVVNIEMNWAGALRAVFEKTVPGRSETKSSGEAFLKPNGIDSKVYAFASP